MTSPYFEQKKERKEKAEKHTREMERRFPSHIADSASRTIVYGGEDKQARQTYPETQRKGKIPVSVDNLDSVTSALQHHTGKTAVLNFASYKHPGGMFLNGSSAQEECLCHASNLYNILKRCGSYYAWNQKHLNHALYTNRALYTPDVLFLDNRSAVYGAEDTVIPVDVITCAAPNYTAASRYCAPEQQDAVKEENRKALLSRIKFLLDIAEENHVETLILGGFGCGVFGQDAKMVALGFKMCLQTYGYHFKRVYFSLIDVGNTKNYQAFQEILGK